jgi:hypothetical protein
LCNRFYSGGLPLDTMALAGPPDLKTRHRRLNCRRG